MAHKFPSAAWTDALKEQINSSDAYASAAKNWEGDLTFVIDDSNQGIYLDLWHGKCRAAEFLTDPHAKTAEFRISAPFEKWRRVLEGTLDPIQGMVTRQLRLDGNLVKIMKNVKAAQELVKCATNVDTTFD